MATLSNLAMVAPINQWPGYNRRCGSLALKRGQQISLKGADCLYLGKKDPLTGMKPGPCAAGHRSMAQSCRRGGLAAPSRASSKERPGGFGLCPGQLQTSPKRIFTLAVQIFLFLHLMLDILSSQLVLAAPGSFSHP